MLEYTITFIAVFLTDIIYVNLVKSIQQDHIFHAAFLGTTITFANSVAIINYTNDHLAIFPALAGAFVGTLVGMKIRKKEQT
jgi:hypothetical protein